MKSLKRKVDGRRHDGQPDYLGTDLNHIKKVDDH